jgi:hypothetical protein
MVALSSVLILTERSAPRGARGADRTSGPNTYFDHLSGGSCPCLLEQVRKSIDEQRVTVRDGRALGIPQTFGPTVAQQAGVTSGFGRLVSALAGAKRAP